MANFPWVGRTRSFGDLLVNARQGSLIAAAHAAEWFLVRTALLQQQNTHLEAFAIVSPILQEPTLFFGSHYPTVGIIEQREPPEA